MAAYVENGTFNTSDTHSCQVFQNAHISNKESDTSNIFMIVVILLVVILGLIANSLMCFALCSTSHLRTVTNIFTINLGITDLGIVCFIMPMWIAGMVQDHNLMPFKIPLSISLCKFTSFLTLTLVFVSAATLACISFDRYVCICHPLKYPRKVTVIRVVIVMVYIWIQGILLASTPLYGWGCYGFKPMSIAICNNLWLYSTSYSMICFIVGLAIPFVIMMVSYICIFQVARNQARRIQAFTMELVNPWGQEDEHKNICVPTLAKDLVSPKVKSYNQPQKPTSFTSISKSLKTLQTAFIVVGIFMLCWVPYVTLQFWSASHPDQQVASGVEFVCTLLAFANSCVNPLVFMLLTRDLRLRIKNLCKKVKTFVFTRSNPVGAAETQARPIHWPILGHQASVQVIHLGDRAQGQSHSYYSSDDEESDSTELPKLAEALLGVSQLFGGINQRRGVSTCTGNNDQRSEKVIESTVIESKRVNTATCCFHEQNGSPVFSTAITVGSDNQIHSYSGKQRKKSAVAWRE